MHPKLKKKKKHSSMWRQLAPNNNHNKRTAQHIKLPRFSGPKKLKCSHTPVITWIVSTARTLWPPDYKVATTLLCQGTPSRQHSQYTIKFIW